MDRWIRGKQFLQPVPLDLAAVVRGAGAQLALVAGPGIQITVVADPRRDQVLADPESVERALVNLVTNARDAMGADGRITITVRNSVLRADTPLVTRGNLAPGDYVELVVADTGPGMSAEVLAHVFDPYFTTKEQGKGTGLGLPSAQGIARQSGGDVWIDTEPGVGTAVSILLPSTGKVRESSQEPHISVDGPPDTANLHELS